MIFIRLKEKFCTDHRSWT